MFFFDDQPAMFVLRIHKVVEFGHNGSTFYMKTMV